LIGVDSDILRIPVGASVPSPLSRQLRYSASPLRRHAVLLRFPAVLCLLALAFLTTACSFSYQLDNMFTKTDHVGALRPGTGGREPPAEGDLAFARAAATEALAKGGQDASVPWENPTTGARGTITPLAQAYRQEGGATCRDFLASYVRDGSESWLQGEACRATRGRWEVRNLRPWN
jgi:surface antigen